ncbi:hypothetical protein K505DRAFT_349779 [Melanomma pulvis-pyrius CBS 109.77]|uniref:RING-type domain-containing protein n=1 Tax=Melanomma pulvis-pyrius CBS 109.77 TaxID=1314802 RepID=A0A6A6XDA9_9PLEO|nr:hypothetical protein K505DRAFT_349779 [Melanomma pulvis-pyrius CBS 109.77]
MASYNTKKHLLQGKRKPIEGECGICHDDLQPSTEEITFCSSSCGGNMHYDCMKDWEERRLAAAECATCPLCHTQWKEQKDEQFHRFPDFNKAGFRYYTEWIYEKKICIRKPTSSISHIEAYLLGVRLQDRDFRLALMGSILEYIKETQRYPDFPCIQFVYQKTRGQCALRRFLVEIHVSNATSAWYENNDNWRRYPMEFMKDMVVAFLHTRDERDKLDWEAMKENLLDNRPCPTATTLTSDLRTRATECWLRLN